MASPLAHLRIGIIVPKHKHSAVERNRLKRRLRELARTELVPAMRRQPVYDVAIRARADTYRVPFDALRDDIRTLSIRLSTELSARA
jgi:ribonuclease P protein component